MAIEYSEELKAHVWLDEFGKIIDQDVSFTALAHRHGVTEMPDRLIGLDSKGWEIIPEALDWAIAA